MFVLVLLRTEKAFHLEKARRNEPVNEIMFLSTKFFSTRETDRPCAKYGARALEMTPGGNLGLFCSTQDLAANVKLESLTKKGRFSTV